MHNRLMTTTALLLTGFLVLPPAAMADIGGVGAPSWNANGDLVQPGSGNPATQSDTPANEFTNNPNLSDKQKAALQEKANAAAVAADAAKIKKYADDANKRAQQDATSKVGQGQAAEKAQEDVTQASGIGKVGAPSYNADGQVVGVTAPVAAGTMSGSSNGTSNGIGAVGMPAYGDASPISAPLKPENVPASNPPETNVAPEKPPAQGVPPVNESKVNTGEPASVVTNAVVQNHAEVVTNNGNYPINGDDNSTDRNVPLSRNTTEGGSGQVVPAVPAAHADAGAAAANAKQALPSQPLMVIRFNQSRVYFAHALDKAVSSVAKVNPTASYTVISYVPQRGNSAQGSRIDEAANDNVQAVVTEMENQGVPNARITVLKQAASDDTHRLDIFVQ